MTYHLKNEERPSEFNKVGNKIDSNYLIYEFKTEEKCPKIGLSKSNRIIEKFKC